MKVIKTDKAPGAIGPYSQAMIVNNIVYCSGQIPIDPKTGAIEGATIEAQTEMVCKNVEGLLSAAGTSIEKVFKTTCYLSDMAHFAAFNEVYGKHFVSNPARSCVAVKTLPKNVLVEVEAIAEL